MFRPQHAGIAAALMLSLSGAASAQQDRVEQQWTRGTTLAGSLGVATASSHTGLLSSAAAGWEITPWLGLEGSGAWLDRPGDSTGFHAALSARVDLTRPGAVVPFIKGGIGLYRASFGASDADMPDFYRRRLGERSRPLMGSSTFTDTSLVVGGGAHLFTTRHIEMGPAVDFLIVEHASRRYVVTTFTVRLAYHFEEHLVGPPGR